MRAAAFPLLALSLLACQDKSAARPPEPSPAAGAATSTRTAVKKLRAALVLDIGGVDDKSFNESAYRGLKRAVSEAH
jgi:basic membrane protein A